MAISKVIYTDLNGNSTTWMDATPATAAAADITLPKTAMLANGIVTAGTGSGGGGGGAAPVDTGVQFIDYDGTLVETWATSTVASKTALPSNPSHTGLTAQGWNWTLTNIKSYIASYPTALLTVGQMYVTASGATEIDIELQAGRLSPYLGIAVNGSVDVDWGDGSTHSTVTGSSLTTQVRTLHNYAAAGEYTIKISVNSGSYALRGTSSYAGILNANSVTLYQNMVYMSAIKAVRMGSSVTLSNYGFYNCYNIRYITIPSSVTSLGTSSVSYCHNLVALTIPQNVTTISSDALNYNSSLQWLSLPDGISTLSTNLNSCVSLKAIAYPRNITSLVASTNSSCYTLQKAIVPNNVTTLNNSIFQNNYALRECVLSNNITTVGTNIFTNCQNLQKVNIPTALTALNDSFFSSCYSLCVITLPSDVETIGSSVFSNCRSLSTLSIPSKVSSIGASAFSNCYGLGEIHFKPTTPPTVANSNTFNNLPTDCKIYVPTGTLSDYTSATNYPSSSTYTYIEE